MTDWNGIDPEIAHEYVGPGWHGLVKGIINEFEHIGGEYTILQVKEKFGGLRFYFQGDKHLHELQLEAVRQAEADSYITCEMCGHSPDVTTEPSEGSFWTKTLCRYCRVKTVELIALRKQRNEKYSSLLDQGVPRSLAYEMVFETDEEE